MRDAQSALDQVIAFAGKTVGVDDVSTVLGLVGRDLLMDVIEAVVAEDGPRAFALTERAVESGTDLRLVCRELSQVVRDMMVMSVDPSRAGDGELAPEERERLAALAPRVLARGSDARVRSALDGGAGDSQRLAPALPLRDDAAALDAPAEAGAVVGSAGADGRRRNQIGRHEPQRTDKQQGRTDEQQARTDEKQGRTDKQQGRTDK